MYGKSPLQKTLTAAQEQNLNPALKEAIKKSAPTKRLKYCSGKSKSFNRKKY